MDDRGRVYRGTAQQRQLHAAVITAAADLRGQLRALAQLGRSMDSATVEAVRGVLFRAHGWRRAR